MFCDVMIVAICCNDDKSEFRSVWFGWFFYHDWFVWKYYKIWWYFYYVYSCGSGIEYRVDD